MRFFWTALFALLFVMADAQEKPPAPVISQAKESIPDSIPVIDVVYLKDGSILKGSLVEYRKGEYLIFRLSEKVQMKIEDSDVERIVQELPEGYLYTIKRERKRNKPYAFREQGFYSATYFSTMMGRTSGEAALGLGLQASGGYQFHRLLGAGLGLGYEGYDFFDGGESFLPVFGEVRGYILPKKRSPYLAMAAGYGFIISQGGGEGFLERRGGLMIHPALGLRLGGDRSGNIMIDLGYKFQEAYFEQQVFWEGDVIIRDVVYRRLTLRVGVLF